MKRYYIFLYLVIYSILICIISLLNSSMNLEEPETFEFMIVTIAVVLSPLLLYLLDKYINFYGYYIDYFLQKSKIKKLVLYNTLLYASISYLLLVIINYVGLSILNNEMNIGYIYIVGFIITAIIMTYSYLVNYLVVNSTISIVISPVLILFIYVVITSFVDTGELQQSSIFNFFTVLRIIQILNLLLIMLLTIDKPSLKNKSRVEKYLSFSSPLNSEIDMIFEEELKEETESNKLAKRISNLINDENTTEIDIKDDEFVRCTHYLSKVTDEPVFTNIFVFKSSLIGSPKDIKDKIQLVLKFERNNDILQVSNEKTNKFVNMGYFEKNMEIFEIARQLNFKYFILFIHGSDYIQDEIEKINILLNGNLKVIKIIEGE